MSINVQISDGFRNVVERRMSEGNFSSVSEYIESLVARDVESDCQDCQQVKPDDLEELKRLIAEGEESIDRGDCSEWQPGDGSWMFQEMLAAHRRKNGK